MCLFLLWFRMHVDIYTLHLNDGDDVSVYGSCEKVIK